MKKIMSVFAMCVMAMPVAYGAGPARRAAADQMVSAPRATASVNQLNSGVMNTQKKSSIKADPEMVPVPVADAKDMREKERAACTANNIGVGNTFVWASRYSNTNNYASMVEDTDEPANNVCFVRVNLKSADSRINVSDIDSKYFEMGRTITCGSWADEETLKKRILDAKKTARTLATVGGAIGGAGVGVGAMELFGNKLIGGKVQGQKSLEENDLFRSQLLVLKKDNASEYNRIINELKTIREECNKQTGEKIDECNRWDYDRLIATQDAK